MEELEEIKKNLKTGKLVVGTEQTIKDLKLGKVRKVFMSSNCPQSVREDVKYYCGFSQVPFVELDVPNDDVGILCKKQFSISVLSLLK